MTFDLTKPVQTRDGHKARIICTNRKNITYPVVVLITNDMGYEEIFSYTSNGQRYYNGPPDQTHDLVNVPEIKSWWHGVHAEDWISSGYHRRDAINPNTFTSLLEIRMLNGILVEAIQHPTEPSK